MKMTLGEVAAELGARLVGDSELKVGGLGTIRSAVDGDLTFLANPRYRTYLANTRATAVLCTEDQAPECPVAAIVVADPYLAFARISHFFDDAPRFQPGIHDRALVSPEADVDETAFIGPNVIVEPGASIGPNVQVMANCYVGARAVLGKGVRLWPNVTIYHGVRIGERSIIHAAAVIGSDGFGYAHDGNAWNKVAQVGAVRVGADVEIGAGTTIDRGAIGDTVIGDGVILDNQVHVAHNVEIGEHTACAAKVGISGSTKIGRHCMLAGMVGVAGHLEITDGVQILGMTLVSRSVTESGVYGSALQIDKQKRWQRNVARFRHLDELYRRVVRLEKRIAEDD